MTMTTDVVARAEALLADVTPQPWTAYHRNANATAADDEMSGLGWQIGGPPESMRGQFARAADAQFIAASPQIVIDLLAEVRRLRALVDGMVDVAADALRADGREKG